MYEAVPFRPFRVHMASGKSADVPHPEFMHLSPNGRRLVVEADGDAFEIIDVSLVTSIEALPQNGSRRRRRRKPQR
jgi:hypothetical protein